MELEIRQQALGLLCFFCLGLALGLLYDLLRPIRYRCKRAFIPDFVFCTLAAAAAFLLSMQSGRPETWNILLCLAAFCLYINLISPVILPIILQIFEGIYRLLYSIVQNLKIFTLNVKKFFTNEEN